MDPRRYIPVSPDFYDTLNGPLSGTGEIRVNYFTPGMEVRGIAGKFVRIRKGIPGTGEFLVLENHSPVRLDRIVTLNGKPGPAFDEYDDFANACLSCEGGM